MRVWSLTCVVASLLAGCGSGSAEEPITVTIVPPVANICAPLGYERELFANVTLSREPTKARRVKLYMDGTVFDPEWAYFTWWEDSYEFGGVWIWDSLAAGVYEGAISFDICKNDSCTIKYPLIGAELPYRVEVVPPIPPLAVEVDGVPVEGSGSLLNNYVIDSGQTVTLTSQVPVTWGTGSSMGGTVETISQTDTTWTVTISGSPTQWIGLVGGAPCGWVQQATAYFSFRWPQ